MKAVHLTKYEYPKVNLELAEIPEPGTPGPGEILVRVNYSPVNYSDLLTAWGFYAVLPPVPAVIGGEGVGTVEQVGADVKDIKPGDKVTLPPGPGVPGSGISASSRFTFGYSYFVKCTAFIFLFL